MAITASDVNALRQKTGVGMMDCKKALTEANGDMDKAVEILREKGMATAAKKAGRIAAEGIVDSYIHMGGKVGVLVEVNCETDFVARGDQFKALVHDIALQIAAAKPLYVTKEEVPADVLEEEKKILKIQAMNEGKPEAIAEKMVQGRIKKYYEDFCLLEQPFVKDSSKTIGQHVTEAIAAIGEKITVRRFVRYEMGEGIEKKKDDLAEEVEKQVSKMKGSNLQGTQKTLCVPFFQTGAQRRAQKYRSGGRHGKTETQIQEDHFKAFRRGARRRKRLRAGRKYHRRRRRSADSRA